MAFDVTKHTLVSKHLKVSDTEKESVFKQYNINSKDLPKILKDDIAIAHLNLKVGDLVKIERVSKTAGIAVYYRVIIEG
ncbi:MAG: DNA-directed RNA polymerase subunit H [Nanoarchaeota archaeon]|nr:DNA-directed RNA polymerase subunit H [Nanoarchaeota archaeon]MBU1632679.1 DNA-directed RNA polymerase subunit H [Nanoarchaeota archaeon]MBU1876297.1 DNA-directed RNA polymerase subunit H [Nanoarchaeota archaeon]